jgi:hypothetical protein
MTRSEVENSLEMRIVFREMVKKYPFILDIKMTDDFDEDNIKYDWIYFSEITISNSKVMEQYPDWSIRSWMDGRLEKDGQINNLFYLGELYQSMEAPTPTEVQNQMDEVSYQIHTMIRKQTTIPKEFKLKKQIVFSQFKVVK